MESRKKRHQHEIKAAESLDAAQNKLSNGKRRKIHGTRNRIIGVILAIFVIVGIVFMAKTLLTDKNAALNPQDTTFKTVNIPTGSTASQMGQTLQNKKIIKNSKNFYKYAMSQGAEKLQAGTYQLSPSQTTQLIFEQMTSGPGAAPKLPKGYVLVSVGQTADQVAQHIADEVSGVSEQDILTALDSKSLINQMQKKYPDLLRGVDQSNTKTGKLLDYIYPQAFDLSKDKTAHAVISNLLEVSNKTMQPYYGTLKENGLPTPNIMALLATSGKSEFERRLAFVRKVAPYAQELSKKYGLLASVSIAQAAHESNWDNSKLSSKYNNFYGVKTQDETPGKSVVLDTTEYVDGKPETQQARFAVYDSWKDSMREHAETIVNGNTWNPNQFKDVIAAKNYKQAAKALYDNHYATDVNYTKLLVNVIETWNMQRYDK
ncbi:endolytic transglycosylase MltG [Leuconostoc gasicomitatum]|uniref:endolytic transglycosylase MltG n=1 Tax=Leuconostoc gasicomitatum TaxID=115778 RepID=UPI0007E1B220|nr:endolytic transglycosylase MltG [Leuconostoc gasicomitatum]MBR2276946.1 endolytic transglycosylase MltG [Leuconostoc sp.]MBZ5944300.1 endolytic transglycosylase MltG [Leuconostoc gasicomitatum]MBZ5948680.1 endolytic transglycosylase MltG [Leuconostoc gasicomitatum]MBZ5950492.1 endolytic transglycosylase MltG [Leuconostoc gasicomitatum]MBZ5950794.1 endolytic transglycosylase MltG [Leuconostoc gasicomitatum]